METLLSIIACGLLTGLFTYLLFRQKHAIEEAKLSGELQLLKTENDRLVSSSERLKIEFQKVNEQLAQVNQDFATVNAEKGSLESLLESEKKEISSIRKQFTMEFENIASKILKENTKSFSEKNEKSISDLLTPLSKNLKDFKERVNDVYDKESKERFSLANAVKEMREFNEQISKDAQNLTNALKSDPKKQGNWGEMVLERILEQRGLTKNREYFVENYLKDEHGKYLLNAEGKKMRPDIIVQYPDARKVIIDSKVSINAFIRLTESESEEEQKQHLKDHLLALRAHIDTLSSRGYEEYEDSLDHVMMFIPNEPAFMVAMQHDKDLWEYAYKKRIVIISPTNIIVALKMVEDLWKREKQGQNTKEIAERGAKLYDKFVGFLENFKAIGKNIALANKAYDNAFGQLAEGRDNLVSQTEKMKALGLSTKKSIDPSLLNPGENQSN